MTAIAIFLLLTALLGVASARGWTRDSRDPEYSAGRLLDRERRPSLPDRS